MPENKWFHSERSAPRVYTAECRASRTLSPQEQGHYPTGTFTRKEIRENLVSLDVSSDVYFKNAFHGDTERTLLLLVKDNFLWHHRTK